jgi:hypothetical protein
MIYLFIWIFTGLANEIIGGKRAIAEIQKRHSDFFNPVFISGLVHIIMFLFGPTIFLRAVFRRLNRMIMKIRRTK